MQIRLGYACITTTLDNVTTSRTLTYTHFKKLGLKRGVEKIKQLTKENLNDLKKIIYLILKMKFIFIVCRLVFFLLLAFPKLILIY